jgi:hypothetical protein
MAVMVKYFLCCSKGITREGLKNQPFKKKGKNSKSRKGCSYFLFVCVKSFSILPVAVWNLPQPESGPQGESLKIFVNWYDLPRRQVFRNFVFPYVLSFQAGSSPKTTKLKNHFHFTFWDDNFSKRKEIITNATWLNEQFWGRAYGFAL